MKFKFLDRERELKYSFGEIHRIREKYGSREFSVEDIPDLVYRGLKLKDPEITKAQIPDIVDMETFNELLEAIRISTGMARPKETPRPTVEISESSGPSRDSTSESPNENSGS